VSPARLVGLDHRGITEDRFDQCSILTYGDSLPFLVSPELGEREVNGLYGYALDEPLAVRGLDLSQRAD